MDTSRLRRYAERYFDRNHEWPTVRQAAHSFTVSQGIIAEACEDDEQLFLTSYFADDQRIGDHFIESYTR